MDPYRYEKHRLAEATREERLCRMIEAGVRRNREGLFHLKKQLTSLDGSVDLSDADKRRVLFEWWDECLGGAPGTGEETAGDQARATILAFIRRAFPSRTPRAYPPAELAMLNTRRTSRAPFDPYGDLTPDAGIQ